MAINNFIPKVWSANLLSAKENIHVYPAVANREFEGDIKGFGDTVQISQIADITAATYTKNSTTITAAELQDAASLLLIDQSKYFAFKIDDIDAAQSKPKVMKEAMRKAAYALNDTQDSYMAGLYADAGLSQNTNASPANMTSLNVDEEFLAVAETLDDANVSRANRFAIIPPWVVSKLVLAGSAAITDNTNIWVNGYIGKALGFNMRVSNNVSKNSSSWDKTRILCGAEKEAFILAEQILKVEAYRPENSFSDAVKGLHVYGAKIRSDVTCVLYANKTAEA